MTAEPVTRTGKCDTTENEDLRRRNEQFVEELGAAMAEIAELRGASESREEADDLRPTVTRLLEALEAEKKRCEPLPGSSCGKGKE